MKIGSALLNKITEDKRYSNMTSSQKNIMFSRLWDTPTFWGHFGA
jgi:hypothetical protein